MTIYELKFYNRDALHKERILHLSKESIAPVMSWYGAYFAGDRYTVYVDGKRVRKDLNGELAQVIKDK